MFFNGMEWALYFDSWFKRMDRQLEKITRPDYHTDTQLDIMADQINDGFTDLQDRIGDDLEDKIDTVESRIGDVEGQIEDLDGKINVVEAKIDTVENKIDAVESTVNDVEGKFDEVETYVDNRLIVTEEHLTTGVYELRSAMDHRFKQLEKRMDLHFEETRTLSHNGLCRQWWQQVKPVWRTNAQGNRALPLHFPHTVIIFWNLKHATKRNELSELLKFYKVRGFEQWRDHDDQDRAQAYQDLAHRALAIELGLSYDAIQANMDPKITSEYVNTAPTAGPSRGHKRRRVNSLEAADPPRTPTAALPTQPVARRTRAKRTK